MSEPLLRIETEDPARTYSKLLRLRELRDAKREANAAPLVADSPGALAAELTGGMEAQRPHLDKIDQAYRDLADGVIDRVMIDLAPQTGKTRRSGVWGPLWWLRGHPSHHVIYTSHGVSLSQRAGRAVRNIIEQDAERLGLYLAHDSRSRSDWDLQSGGGMLCAGVRGGITGRPGDFGIVDDPFKDRIQADSAKYREDVWEWYSGVFVGRLSPGAPVLVIGHQWHRDGLHGRLLDNEGREEEGGRWRVIHLPAIAVGHVPDAEADDPRRYPDALGRNEGDPLPHPKIPLGDRAALLAFWHEKRRTVTPRDWQSLYQGDPRDSEGKLLTWKQLRAAHVPNDDTLPARRKVAVAVDPSGGGEDEAGIGGGFLGADGRAYLTHDRSGRMPSDQWGREACLLAHEIGADVIVFESNYGGDQARTIIRMSWDVLLREGLVTGLCPRIVAVPAKRGKILRADPVAQAVVEDRARFAGVFPELDAQWGTYSPGEPSPDRLDMSVYLFMHLLPSAGSAPAQVVRAKRRVPTGATGTLG